MTYKLGSGSPNNLRETVKYLPTSKRMSCVVIDATELSFLLGNLPVNISIT